MAKTITGRNDCELIHKVLQNDDEQDGLMRKYDDVCREGKDILIDLGMQDNARDIEKIEITVKIHHVAVEKESHNP